MVEKIMLYLPQRDRKAARLVGSCWRDVSYAKKFMKNEVLKVNRYRDLNRLTDSKRKYFHVVVKEENKGEEETAADFWEKFGDDVRSLKMFLQRNCITEVFPNIPNVEEMMLCETLDHVWIPRRDVVPCFFPKLGKLSLCYIEKLGEEEFGMLVEHAPSLKKLILGMNTREPDLVDSLEAFVNRQGNILQLLDFKDTRIEDSQLMRILTNIGPQMVELHLPNITDACLPFIQQKMPNLKKISLRTACSDEGIDNLLRALVHLTHIDIAYSLVGDRTALLLPTMPHLCSIDLSGTSEHFDQYCLRLAFCTQSLPQMTELRMCFDPSVEEIGIAPALTDQILEEILPFLPNLKFLYLREFPSLSNSAVKHISNFCKDLRLLSLSYCSGISDVSPVNALKNLEYLCLRECAVAISADRPLRLPKLKEILLKGNVKNVISEFVEPDERHVLRLKEIVQRKILNWRSNKEAIDTLAENCPSLQNIYFGIKLSECDVKEIESCHGHFGIHYVTQHNDPWWETRTLFNYKKLA